MMASSWTTGSVKCACSPWKTSTFQKLTAVRKPKVVIMYSTIGIQGLIKLAMRRLRGRVYDDALEEEGEADAREEGEAQLDAIGQGAGENGCWSCDGRGWCVRCERIHGGMEETGDEVCERENDEGPALGDMSRVGPAGLLDICSCWDSPAFSSWISWRCAKRCNCGRAV